MKIIGADSGAVIRAFDKPRLENQLIFYGSCFVKGAGESKNRQIRYLPR